MGQPIEVVKKSGTAAGLVRFETNRWLTGMGHERYHSPEDIVGDKTVDHLATRLFATGDVRMVHVNGSVVTVELVSEDVDLDHLADVIRGLHIHYPADGGAGTNDAGSGAGDETAASAVAPVGDARG